MKAMRIVLVTVNARYSHSSFGLRYLRANLGPFRDGAHLLEFTFQDRPIDMAERILSTGPDVVACGIYLWNLEIMTQVVALLKAVRPSLQVILGGPEISYEFEHEEVYRAADHLISGEADLALPQLLTMLEAGHPCPKHIHAPLPDLETLALPYEEYSDEDLEHRLVYVEASRGCPFGCHYCLSCIEPRVRRFPLSRLLPALERLLSRGARAFKFVDRSFNVEVRETSLLLEFLLERHRPGFSLHFEWVADRLHERHLQLLSRFPPGAIQLEVGVQTFHEEVLSRVGREQSAERLETNLRRLKQETGVRLHADLLLGLPGEEEVSIASSFNRLARLEPDEIQVGFLKRLKGTPMGDGERGLVFDPHSPYEVLMNSELTFHQLQDLKRMARYFDLYYNRGQFHSGVRRVLSYGGDTPFQAFRRFAQYLTRRWGKTHEISLARQFQALFDYLVLELGKESASVAGDLLADYDREGVRRERLEFLRPFERKLRGDPSVPSAPLLQPGGPANKQAQKG